MFMYDAITPGRIQAENGRPVDFVAGYVDGRWPSYRDARARYPRAVPVSIAVFADADAQVLDVEQYDATPAESVGWAVRQRRRGQIPTVYCNTSTFPQVRDAFARAGVALPLWWAAQYDDDPTPVPGAIAKQFRNTAGYDVSSVRGYWPGVSPVNHRPPPPRPHPWRHVIRAGESLSWLAGVWGVSLSALERANPNAGHPAGNVDNIWPGDVIIHP